MALEAGIMVISVEFAKDLKDKDFFGKQDPYVILTCGSQTYRTKTAKDGGKNPVWGETFRFNVINENDITFKIMDDDTGKDETIGTGRINLAKTREQGTDRLQCPVMSKSGKQHGFMSVNITFERNSSLRPAAAQVPQMMMQPQMMAMQPQPYGYAPMPMASMPPHGYAPMPQAGYSMAPGQPYMAPYPAPYPGYPPAGAPGAAPHPTAPAPHA